MPLCAEQEGLSGQVKPTQQPDGDGNRTEVEGQRSNLIHLGTVDRLHTQHASSEYGHGIILIEEARQKPLHGGKVQ